MTGVDELNKRWETTAARPIAPEMSFDGDCLVLGAQTRLAKVDKATSNSTSPASSAETARLFALLAAAHGRPIGASSLMHIERALEKKRDGDLVLALIHLALSGAAKLRDPKEDARRLFLADALMNNGVAPSVIVKGLGFDPSPPDEALDKYSPDQPRVPAGNTDGGQWTQADSAPAAPQIGPPPRFSSAAPSPKDADGSQIELAADTNQTCEGYIAANCQARILRVFPGQYLTCTLQEVLEAAKRGDAAARCAKKLLFNNIYKKTN